MLRKAGATSSNELHMLSSYLRISNMCEKQADTHSRVSNVFGCRI